MGFVVPGREIAGLAGRYAVERALPRSGFASAHVATDASGARVLLKEVHVEDVDAWSRFDALVREAKTTRHLRFARIPRHIELFAFDGKEARPIEPTSAAACVPADGGTASLVLVRTFIEGETLADAIKSRRRFTAIELEAIFRGLLSTRTYLDTLMPAVVHGDIAPANVVVDAAGEAWLIDFGGAFEATSQNPSAAVGTMGFMAPEQIAGSPVPASDLYALAMSVMVAATHREPNELPRDATTGKLDVEKAASALPDRFVRALEACLEPEVSSRARTALEARELLLGHVGSLGEGRSRARRFVRANRKKVIAAAAFLAMGAMALGVRRHGSSPVAGVANPVPTPPAVQCSVPIPDSLFGSKTRDPAPIPSGEPAAPPPPPPHNQLEWTGTVATATGDARHRKGESCVASLDIEGTVLDPHEAICTVRVTCGDETLLVDEHATDCTIHEIVLDAHAFAYEAAFDTSHLPGVDSVSVVASTRERKALVQTFVGDAVTESLTIDLDARSQARSGDALVAQARIDAPTTIEGTLVSATGLHGPTRGEACTVGFEPLESTRSNPDDNCTVKLTCGSARLYQGKGVCQTDGEGKPIYFDDSRSSMSDGSPRFSAAGHLVEIGDATLNGFSHATVYVDTPLSLPQEE